MSSADTSLVTWVPAFAFHQHILARELATAWRLCHNWLWSRSVAAWINTCNNTSNTWMWSHSVASGTNTSNNTSNTWLWSRSVLQGLTPAQHQQQHNEHPTGPVVLRQGPRLPTQHRQVNTSLLTENLHIHETASVSSWLLILLRIISSFKFGSYKHTWWARMADRDRNTNYSGQIL